MPDSIAATIVAKAEMRRTHMMTRSDDCTTAGAATKPLQRFSTECSETDPDPIRDARCYIDRRDAIRRADRVRVVGGVPPTYSRKGDHRRIALPQDRDDVRRRGKDHWSANLSHGWRMTLSPSSTRSWLMISWSDAYRSRPYDLCRRV